MTPQPNPSRRVVVTGMSIRTPLGGGLALTLERMLNGDSAITRWKGIDSSRISSKIGGDLSEHHALEGLREFAPQLREETAQAAKKLISRLPWSTGISVELALRAAIDANFYGAPLDPERVSTIIAGHNINLKYIFDNHVRFNEDPDYIEPLFSLHGLDTGHAAVVSEALGIFGGASTVGAACASGNLAIKSALEEIRSGTADMTFVVGSVFEMSPLDLHGLGIMGAISIESFNDDPARASRAFDKNREGFVPSQAGAALVLESLESARNRGARIYAEILGVGASSDASHLPRPSHEGQVRAIRRVLATTGVRAEEIDYVNAHATSTRAGDVTELRSLKTALGDHAKKVAINAPKSMLGHPCWSAVIVETVTAILQMNASKLYPSINIDELDPEADLDIVRGSPRSMEIRTILKNSFGFGGMNYVSLIRKYEAGGVR